MTNQNDGDESNKTVITLKGSVSIVSDFFFTAINSILYQRGTFCRTNSACLQAVFSCDTSCLHSFSDNPSLSTLLNVQAFTCPKLSNAK